MIKKIRSLSNWLIFRIGKQFFEKYSVYFKGTLVDLGCGEKPYEKFFLQHATQYIGVDWSSSLHNIQADIICDLNKKIDLDNNFADSIVSLSVMEHLNEPQQFLNEAFRVLKPKGHLVLQIPFQWWIHEAPHDYFRFTPYGLKHLLHKAGFTVLEISPSGGFFTMLAIKINYFSIRMLKLPKPLWVCWLIMLIPFWTLNQILAPFLDKLFDQDYSLETTGYWVVAYKEETMIEDRKVEEK